MKNIIITARPWEKRIAIIENNLLQNIYFDSKTSNQLERSFFKGKVAKILPAVQTAFVDIGQNKAGFLHVSEIDREMAFSKMYGEEEEFEEDSSTAKKNPPSQYKEAYINEILKQNECILVQVNKEPINAKGAKLTTCFALPGRFIVFMPNIPKVGISKKISSPDERKRLKDIVMSILPEASGCIVRTTCENRLEEEIIQDIRYLIDVWKGIQERYEKAKPEECVYRDIDLTLQIVRDHLDKNIESIICDNKAIVDMITDFASEVAPEFCKKIIFYNEPKPLFEIYNIENQVQKALESRVDLASGGSIIIDSTEAMTVIDVNTARYTGKTKLEDSILKTNLEAAAEIVRQLKLRNIGGLVVIDFIDMSTPVNRNKLFTFFEKTLKEHDKSQSVVLKISEFGLIQMTRKRTGKTLHQQLLERCKACCGTGVAKSIATHTYELCRILEKIFIEKTLNEKHRMTSCIVNALPALAEYLIEVEYDSLLFLEKKYKISVVVKSDETLQTWYTFDFA